mgnify:CR=1 FL=1
MNIRTLILAAATLFPVAAPATADHRQHGFSLSEALFRDCQSDAPALRGMCLGYLAAIADSIETQQVAGAAPRVVCDPLTVSLEDYRRALIVFLQGNPALLKQPSSDVVRAAYSNAWPCKG